MAPKAAEPAATTEALSFELAMKELEEIVRRLEGGSGDLESAIRDYLRGTELQRHCQKRLADARMRIESIFKEEGRFSTQPFEQQGA